MSLAPQAPVEGLRPPDQGPESRERSTRPKLKLWDRIKFLMLFTVVWLILVWKAMAENPILPFEDANREQAQSLSGLVLLTLAGLDIAPTDPLLDQRALGGLPPVLDPHVFGGFERFAHRRLSDWTRYRIARVIKWLVWIAALRSHRWRGPRHVARARAGPGPARSSGRSCR